MVELTVQNGIITAVKYNEINEQGAYKSQDEAYLAQYNQVTGLDMAAAMQALETSLTAAQNLDLVDAVSGATYSSNTFKELVTEALAAAPVPAE